MDAKSTDSFTEEFAKLFLHFFIQSFTAFKGKKSGGFCSENVNNGGKIGSRNVRK
jgi:hypothetical protein